jgi:hypothetical protein
VPHLFNRDYRCEFCDIKQIDNIDTPTPCRGEINHSYQTVLVTPELKFYSKIIIKCVYCGEQGDDGEYCEVGSRLASEGRLPHNWVSNWCKVCNVSRDDATESCRGKS